MSTSFSNYYPQFDQELLKGVIDLHVHGAPDIFERPWSELDMAKQAREAGYRGILFKSHFTTSATRVQIYRKLIDGIELFGNLTLNHSVGGINPHAVFAAAGFGVKEVKMPTMHSARHIQVEGRPNYPWSKVKQPPIKGITILDEAGHPIPQLREVLELIAANDIMLSTGHLSKQELRVLISEALSAGVKKILVTHAGLNVVDLSPEEQVEFADMGAFIEHSFSECMPLRRLDPRIVANAIKKVGPNRCIMSSDFGQYHNPLIVEGMRMFIRHMLVLGISKDDIEIMTKHNPAKLMGLD
jgi:hypothetical protein